MKIQLSSRAKNGEYTFWAHWLDTNNWWHYSYKSTLNLLTQFLLTRDVAAPVIFYVVSAKDNRRPDATDKTKS